MNEKNHDLPQEWPEHLAPKTSISTAKTVPPIGEPLLDFAAMDYKTFEQFCWWLLKKDQTLIGCKRLGGLGTSQEGIDLFAFDEQLPDKLNVFECKAWKKFNSTRLTKAINAFLEGSWSCLTKNFTIILAQPDIGEALSNHWVKERQRLKQAGIDGHLWTGHDLTLHVQAYPDILSKFFPWHCIESYANQWMQRVAFYELVSKAFSDPRDRVVRWAHELVAQSGSNNYTTTCSLNKNDLTSSDKPTPQDRCTNIGIRRPSLAIDGAYRSINQYGNSWHFKGPWLSLSAILPDQHLSYASAAITFNRADMKGITLTIDHKWLLKRFLFATAAPLTSQYRGIVAGVMPQHPDQYLIDFPHCRLFLPEDGVQEILGVADLLTEAMRNSLHSLEAKWSAVDFPFVMWGSKKVALATIDARVWRDIGFFVEEHDISNGTTPWHMFDGNNQVLKPYHKITNKHFDAGYHGIFYAAKIDGLSYENEVVLLWQPNDLQSSQLFSPRGWWSCEFALQWLRESLLPEVKKRVYEHNFNKRWKQIIHSRRANELATYLDRLFVARDLRQPPLIRDGNWSVGIIEAIQELQHFFHTAGIPEPYIRQHEIEDLYHTAAIIAQGKHGYVGYLGSKLGLHRSPTDHDDLIHAIHEYIQEGRTVANCAVADNVFSAMLEMLGASYTWLSDSDLAIIQNNITPFAQLRDDTILVDRHTKWT